MPRESAQEEEHAAIVIRLKSQYVCTSQEDIAGTMVTANLDIWKVQRSNKIKEKRRSATSRI